MILLRKILKDCTTGLDGQTFDAAKIVGFGLTVLGGFEFLIISGYMAFEKNIWDPNGFAIGLAGIGGAVAASSFGVWVKRATEPKDGG